VQQLDALVREAAALADPHAEAARMLQVCNACRYCEGFCAVFPAMTRRLAFEPADTRFLANLCHSCGACLHSCQYAPPHEFAINVPRAMARVRLQTYADDAWPPSFAALYRNNGLALSLALAGALALVLLIGAALGSSPWQAVPGGDFYRIFPHGLMVGLFAPVFAFALFALAASVSRFWRRSQTPGRATRAAIAEATSDALRLTYLDGGQGQGCTEADDGYTLARRRAHHLTFYGFVLCFASTCVATLYHYALGWPAPYAYTSVPKVLGIVGGVSLSLGTIALWHLRRRRDPLHGDPDQAPMDRAFMALLLLAALSGLALTALRATPALPALLAVHLGAVLAFFATLPYGKFVHGVYRGAALLRWAIEKRTPRRVQVGDE
jgi:citrate/tricarballylate utilization protein